MSAANLRRYRAERLLRKDFSALRSKVLAIVRSQLRGKGVTLDPSDLEACYAQAWHGLYGTVLAGEYVENPSAWLVTVTFRRAVDEARSAARVKTVGSSSADPTGRDPSGAEDWQGASSNPDLAAGLDDRTRLRQLFEGLRTHLSARECEAASLCYLQGLSRAEAAAQMGISEARMRKLMEGSGAGRPGVAGKVGGLLDTIKHGGWCEQQSSLMRAFAFGILDPDGERHALAASHCRQCPACRAHVASLRGLASVLPLPLLAPAALAGGAGTAATGSGGGGSTGLAGSLTTKLALTAVVVLSTGYAVLGTRAHGSPPARPSAPPPVAGGALLQAPPIARIRGAHRSVGHSASALHVPRLRRARAIQPTAAAEFGPERVSPEAVGAPSRRPPTASEFGLE